MRTDQEILGLIIETAKKLQVNAVALSGSRTNQKIQTDEFQDYDLVYVVDDIDNLTRDISWLDQFGKRIIEQEVTLEHRRLYLMLFEDGNRIDLTLCPQEHMQEWVDSEAAYTVLIDEKGLFESYSPNPKLYWTAPPSEEEFTASCNEFWWVSAYVVKGICRKQVIYATDHLKTIRSRYKKRKPAMKVTEAVGSVN